MSATGVPASTCRKARAICSTLNRLVRIGLCLPGSVREPSAQPATYRFLLVLGGPTIREPRLALGRVAPGELVVSQGPVQSTEQLQQASLLPAGDELLQRLGDRRLFCLLPAHGERTVEELGVDGQIGRHVWTSTHQSTHRWQEGGGTAP